MFGFVGDKAVNWVSATCAYHLILFFSLMDEKMPNQMLDMDLATRSICLLNSRG